MTAFDHSPRAAKKRKIHSDEPTSPIFSRALRSVKQAVYGKSSSPRISSEVFDEAVKSPGKVAKEDPLGERPGRGHEAANALRDPGSGSEKKRQAVDNEDEEVQAVRTRQKSKSQRPANGDTGRIGIGDSEQMDSTRTRTGKKKHKYKGWIYVEEEDELAHNDEPGDELERDTEVGRLKKGRNDLTIDMKPKQIKPRKSYTAIEEAIGGSEEARSTPIGKARRTPRRNTGGGYEANSVKAATVSDPGKRRGRFKAQPAAVPLFGEEVEQHQDITNATAKDASPDELARVSQGEETDQESPIQTSTKKRGKKSQFFRHGPPTEDARYVEESVSATERGTFLDMQTPSNDSAKTLQAMFMEHPEAAEKLRTHILSGLTGKRRLPLINLEDEHQKVKQIVEQTVLAGEGNSMLVIGSRGSGKTLLVETVIAELSSDHRNDFHVVRLNGFIHTDDKLALREIWRQLGREMEVEDEDDDDLGGRSNYADTLTSLLALLAHPAIENDEENQNQDQPTATARSVIFILDEFDLFASHPRQTLLYNLFDVAQSRAAPIAVLGLTTKLNIIDSLEKRVKSRFNQRYVHLSLPKTFTAFHSICLSALTYHPTTHDLLHNTIHHHLSKTWNTHITTLLSTPQQTHHLQKIYTTTKSIPAFLSSALLLLTPFPNPPLQPPSTKLHHLPTLPTLTLSLLISAARLSLILSTDLCSFPMAYDEYVSLASTSKMHASAAGQVAIGGGGARVWSRELARGAWEELVGLELVLPAAGGRAGWGRVGAGVGRGEMWRVDVGLEEIGACLENEVGRGGVLGKWCREI